MLRYSSLSFCISYPVSEITNFFPLNVFVTEFYKLVHLFEFAAKDERLGELINHFLAEKGCVNSWDYMKRVLSLIMPILQLPKPGRTKLDVPKDADYVANCEFLDSFCLPEKADNYSDIDFRILRTYPLIKVDEGIYWVTYLRFLIEKLYTGLLFGELRRLNNEHNIFSRTEEVEGELFPFFRNIWNYLSIAT